MKKDAINPEHYGSGKGMECIAAMLQQKGGAAVQDFCELNAFKYLWRAGNKDKKSQEIQKAVWYLVKWLEIEEELGIQKQD